MKKNAPLAGEIAANEAEHWWDGHPPADPTAEPLYADVLTHHLLAAV